AITNRERVGKAQDLLTAGLAPFVERELKSAHGSNWEALTQADELPGGGLHWDSASLLGTMMDHWNEVFKRIFGTAERSLVSELKHWRNEWAHQRPISSEDAERMLDSAERLLKAVSAPEAQEMGRMKSELRRTVI